jgi:hypothetical protein
MEIDIEDIVPAFVRAEPIFVSFLKSWNTCPTRYTEVKYGLACKELCGDGACWRRTTPTHGWLSRGWVSQQLAYGCSNNIREVAVSRQITLTQRRRSVPIPQHPSQCVTSSWLESNGVNVSLTVREQLGSVLVRMFTGYWMARGLLHVYTQRRTEIVCWWVFSSFVILKYVFLQCVRKVAVHLRFGCQYRSCSWSVLLFHCIQLLNSGWSAILVECLIAYLYLIAMHFVDLLRNFVKQAQC